MSKKLKIFTIGGATFDVFVKADDQNLVTMHTLESKNKYLAFPYGAKVKVQEVLESYGGGGTNTAVTFARMGFDTYFIGKVGEQYGEQVFRNLENSGVNCSLAKQTDKDKTGFSTIINTFDGDRTLLYYAGANRFFTADDLPMKELETADWIFLSHITEENSKIPHKLLKLLKANPNIKLAWNPGHEQIEQGAKVWKDLLAHTEVVFLNKEEASQFTGLPYELAGNKKADPKKHICNKCFLPPYADNVEAILKNLCDYGVKYAVVTDGRNGSQASDGKDHYFCSVKSHRRVDVLGAGDAFSSGFVSALMKGFALKRALIYGTLNAGSVVNCPGAQNGLLDKDTVKTAYQKNNITVKQSKIN